ncbi:MAG: site-specific integrase [Sporomusaceae bacterium]|jgi:integrase|nr:site-specific integrase [Sporomusaceae bacterium]
MAYFRKRGSNWSFTLELGKDIKTGKRKQKTAGGFRTKKEAQLAAAEIEKSLAEGTYVSETDLTLQQFAQEWLSLYRDNVKESSYRIRKYESACLLKVLGEKSKLKDITPRLYQQALSSLKNEGYAVKTITGIHGTGRLIFRRALEFKLIKNDPTQYAKIPRAQKTIAELEAETEIPKYLEREELLLFLKTVSEKGSSDDYVIFLTLAYSGMRIGELCALKWRDIDFKTGVISITKTYYNPANKVTAYQIFTPKTKKSKRVIEIDQIVLQELERHRARQNIIKMKHRALYHDQDFVFAKTDRYFGCPQYAKFIRTQMKKLLKLAGLNPNLTPHSLRHTHTSLLAEAGVGLEEIMERLGHANDTITRNVYLHITKTQKKEAAQKFSQLMQKVK